MANFVQQRRGYTGLIKESDMATSRIDFNSSMQSIKILRPRLHGIGSKWDRIHWDPIHFLRSVYTGSDPELSAFTRDRIHLDFMNS